jgi:ABC-type dipeptide/oligopeptide/nickel transport system permease subunit
MRPASDAAVAPVTGPRDEIPQRLTDLGPAGSRSAAVRLRRRIRTDPLTAGSAAVLVLVTVAAVLAPLLAPHDPNAVDNTVRLVGPSRDHLMGTDQLGRDILSRLIWGGRVSLVTAVVPATVALVAGSVLGILAGYVGGWVDTAVMRVVDTLMSFPYILLAMGIAAALGPGLFNAMLAVTVVTVPIFARLIRAAVLSIKESEFILAARGLGVSGWATVWRHVVPNTLSIMVVYGTLQTGRMVIAAASLSFLGLGVQPPTADWGAMLASGQAFLRVAPHVSTIPGLTIFAVTLAFNVLGEAVRDALDPRYVGDLDAKAAV